MGLVVSHITPANISVTKVKNLQITATINSSTIALKTTTHSVEFTEKFKPTVLKAGAEFTFEDQKNLVFYL